LFKIENKQLIIFTIIYIFFTIKMITGYILLTYDDFLYLQLIYSSISCIPRTKWLPGKCNTYRSTSIKDLQVECPRSYGLIPSNIFYVPFLYENDKPLEYTYDTMEDIEALESEYDNKEDFLTDFNNRLRNMGVTYVSFIEGNTFTKL